VTPAQRDESGQLTPLVIGFVVIVLLMVTVVANASKAFLYRRSLASWADGAVIVAAQNVSEQAIYAGAAGDHLPLAESAARDAVAGYVARHDLADRFDGFAVVQVAVGPGDDVVIVAFAARVPLIWANETTAGFGGGIPVTAEASALAVLR
jgi:uncharacterized membrane protein